MDTDAELEAWTNATAGRIMLRRHSVTGELQTELIPSGKTIHLSPMERKMNQEVAANEDLDVFLNGSLQPVRLLEGEASSEAMAAHPNHLSEDEARRLFKASPDAFAARLDEITNPAAVERLLALAEDPGIGATFHQHQQVQARLNVLNAPQQVDHIRTHAPGRDGRPAIDVDPLDQGMSKAVTPN